VAEEGEETGEEAGMVGNPVEGGGTEDEVDGFADDGGADRLEIALEEADAIAEAGCEVFPGFVQHVLGAVEGDDPAEGETLQDLGGKTTGPAAGVENGLVAVKMEPGEDASAPPNVRLRDAVIDGGVPFDAVGTAGDWVSQRDLRLRGEEGGETGDGSQRRTIV
jgi:hypothetical protein